MTCTANNGSFSVFKHSMLELRSYMCNNKTRVETYMVLAEGHLLDVSLNIGAQLQPMIVWSCIGLSTCATKRKENELQLLRACEKIK